jgi:hypothetical protein
VRFCNGFALRPKRVCEQGFGWRRSVSIKSWGDHAVVNTPSRMIEVGKIVRA